MEYNKFALIPESELSKHVPSKQELNSFDESMLQILNSPLPEHLKVRYYYELLQRKMNLQEFNSPRMSIPETIKEEENSLEETTEVSSQEKTTDLPKQESVINIKKEIEEDYDETILNVVPQAMKRQATTLLGILKKHPHTLRWNERGELIFKDQKISQSNIADLFKLIFTTQKARNLEGHKEFLQSFEDLNIPRSFIKNPRIYNIQPKKHPSDIVNKKHSSGIANKKQKRSSNSKEDLVWIGNYNPKKNY